ncbi:nuclear transport factor 2 family protein [soil metagenome]
MTTPTDTAPVARPPLPPFTPETARQKVRMAEDAWNTRDPNVVVRVYTPDTRWRNRAEFPVGHDQVHAFLTRKWQNELDYRLIKELWAIGDPTDPSTAGRLAVRFAYEFHDATGQWYRSYGNENWHFNAQGLMTHRHASINDLAIAESDRLFHWPLGRRPDDHAGLSELGL